VRRLAAVLGVALAAGAPLACGSDDGDGGATGDLVWVRQPTVIEPEALPRDHVLVGVVRNDSLRRMTIEAKDVHAADPGGNALKGQATFIRGYIHPLYPPTRPPEGGLPDSELIRLGRLVRLEPGERAHLTVAWRLQPGREPPTRIEYGFGSLPIPGG
jgi:hypothetical protein